MDTTEERTGIPPEPAGESGESGESGEEYRRVRELLLGGEQRQLNFLHHRLQEIQHLQTQLDQRCQALQANELDLARRLSTIVQRGDEFVERNLAAAIQRRTEGSEQSREEFVRALKGPVEESLRQSLSEDPERLGHALGPAVGQEVNRGIWEIFSESGFQKLVRFREDGSAKLAWPIATMISLVLIALTGWLVLSIQENLSLKKAVGALKGEPGIIVAAVENPFLGKPWIGGLRDPLAPSAEEILKSAGLSPEKFTLDLQPFQSINTTYAHQREQDRVRDLEDVRRQMIDAIGGLTSANDTVRARDLETFTRALFALQFPEVAGKVTLSFREDQWFLRGAIAEPHYSQMIERASEIVLTGKVDTSDLKNATALQVAQLRSQISGVRLTYLSGDSKLAEDGVRQSKRLVELVREFDAETKKLGRLPASFAVHALPVAGESEFNEKLEESRIEATEQLLMEQAEIPVERFLPGVHDTEEKPGRVGISVEVVEPEN